MAPRAGPVAALPSLTPLSKRPGVEGRRGNVRVDARGAAVCGYGLVRVADRDAAIELATRCPHAERGPVEVREVLFFDRTADDRS